jgi:hypothetical protein
MIVQETALWFLMGACAAVGLAFGLIRQTRRHYYVRHATWREAPMAFAASCVDGVLTGLGVGLGGAALIFFAAALIVRVEDALLP